MTAAITRFCREPRLSGTRHLFLLPHQILLTSTASESFHSNSNLLKMGEFARQPDAPDFPKTPLELLTPRPGENYSLKDKILPAITLSIGAGFCVGYFNYAKRRPIWAGLHIYLLAMGGSYWIGQKLTEMRLESLAEKDAIFKHYVSLHPEDFPPYENKRYKDLFLKWYPVR